MAGCTDEGHEWQDAGGATAADRIRRRCAACGRIEQENDFGGFDEEYEGNEDFAAEDVGKEETGDEATQEA